MPLKLFCPHCGASFNVADTMRGKTVRCKKCAEVFVVKENRSPAAEELDEEEPQERRPKKVDQRLQTRPKQSGSSDAAARRRPGRDDEDDEDEAPGPGRKTRAGRRASPWA